MAKVKNTAKGPRGIRTAKGDLVMIEAGQSADGDFPASEVKDFKAALAFEAGAQPESADEDEADETPVEKPLARMNKAELQEVAKAEAVDVADDASNKQIMDAIEAKRATAS